MQGNQRFCLGIRDRKLLTNLTISIKKVYNYFLILLNLLQISFLSLIEYRFVSIKIKLHICL